MIRRYSIFALYAMDVSVSCAVVQQVQRGSHFRIDVICCDIVCFEVLGAGVE